MYTPEPDICHEILGHVPMFADPSFAELAWVIGQASLGASEKDLWHLAKLYWYTVEFGTVKEGEEIRAFGAGLLSSFGELKHMRDGTDGVVPEFVELDPFTKLPKTSYKDGFQKKYYLCDSFTDTIAKLRAYSRSICNPKSSEWCGNWSNKSLSTWQLNSIKLGRPQSDRSMETINIDSYVD